MRTDFDQATEGERERRLMQSVRAGAIAPDDISREGLPFPVKLQIQTLSPCNASCVMCAWPDTRAKLPQGWMSEDVFHEVVRQIKGRGVKRVGLFLNNEPTLDNRLARLTAHLKNEEPNTRALIFTNGVLLGGDQCRDLADAGMDEVTVSIVGFDRESYSRIMVGCDFDRVVRNLTEIGDLMRAGRLGAMKVAVVGLAFPGMESAAADFSARIGLPVSVKHVTNLAGSIDVEALGVHNELARKPLACQRPFVKAYVLYNGDLVLCNCDWLRTTIIGNVMREPIGSLWHGAVLTAIRQQHIRGSFPQGAICAKCDYPYLP